MPTRAHIGVTTEVSVQSSPTNASVPSGRFQLAGITAKGPLNATTIVRSVGQYVEIFGGRTPFETLYDSVRTYFQEGGAELFVTRVVGPNATNGSVTLNNGDTTTPVDLITIEVKDPGAHSADYQAVVSVNTDGTFDVSVVDTTTGRVIVAYQKAESPSDLASMAMGSDLVVVRALAETGIPAEGPTAFTAGDDNRSEITAETYGTALTAHKIVRAGVAVSCPGQHPETIAAVLGEHCQAKGKIGLLDVPAGFTIDQAKALGRTLTGAAYGSHLSMPLYPALRVPDGTDRSRTVGPSGYVGAIRSVTHRNLSFAAAVAGPRTATMWNFSPVERLDEEDINDLNENGINGIQISGSGAPFLNNWSSLSSEPALYDLNVQDALNNLTITLQDALSVLLWRPNEGRDVLSTEAEAIVAGIMRPLIDGGWLFPSRTPDGSYLDDGYTVNVEDIRTSGQPSPYDELIVNVGVRLSPTLRHIHVPIRKVDLRQNF